MQTNFLFKDQPFYYLALLSSNFSQVYKSIAVILIEMGSEQPTIKVAIIDLRQKPEDFALITQNKTFSCNYYKSYDKFLQNQSLKQLPYIIIRQKLQQPNQTQYDANILAKIKESSVVARTYQNMQDLKNEFANSKQKRQPLLRQKLIAYIRKYSLQKLVIDLFVDDVYSVKIPEYQQPYISLVADRIQKILRHLEEKPKGAEPLNFKFRRLVKDLYRRTVVKILINDQKSAKSQQQIKNYELMTKDLQKQWKQNLGKKITFSITKFNEQEFQESLTSNYYSYIVVSSSSSLSFIQDMKKIYKFDTLLIYHGDLKEYGKQQYQQQTQQKIKQLKNSLWLYSSQIPTICKAIKNCTDVTAEQTTIRANDVIIYTLLNYGKENQQLFANQIKRLLKDPQQFKNLKFSSNNERQQWINNMRLSIISNINDLKGQCTKATFSYFITFDCTIQDIQTVKTHLRHQKVDNRVYMYNNQEKENQLFKVKSYLKGKDNKDIQKYLKKRAKKIIQKGKFQIKFQIGPLDEISTYKAKPKQLQYFRCEMGLITTNIQSAGYFEKYYMHKNRQKIIDGSCLVIKVVDYFKQFKRLVENDSTDEPNSYLKKIKIVILDQRQIIKQYWQDLLLQVKQERVIFVHYSLAKINQFLDLIFVPTLSLTIFVKKALPNFYKAYRKLQQNKFKAFQLTGSIVSKNQLLRQVFGDQNFKLSTQFKLSFLKLANTNKNLQEALVILHDQFLTRYGIMWRTGYQIVSPNRKQCIETLRDDIKSCLYKCKSYQLLQVTEEQFEYFYINRLQQCQTYIDLQITVIYIFSLPHGLSNVLQLIFSQPLLNCLTPKMFTGLIVALLAAFCSFQDEVINKKRFVIYVDGSNAQRFKSITSTLKIGDMLFNSGFFMCGKDEDATQNNKNHCLFLQFEDVPMLSQTHVKNYLNIQRFSFYKQSAQYLIAPFTQFTIKNIEVNQTGKIHITIIANPDSKIGLVSKVLKANSLDEHQFFEAIIEETKQVQHISEKQNEKRLDKAKGSLYKRAELIGLQQQKQEMLKSIRQGVEYRKFLKTTRQKKFMSAYNHITSKEQSSKSTSEIQATYFKKMLGVQLAMVFYHLCEYDNGTLKLQQVLSYLYDQNVQDDESWVIRKIKSYKQNIIDLKVKRAKYLNKFDKYKHWKIQPEIVKIDGEKKLCVKMTENKMKWEVGYQQQIQEFYIQQPKQEKLIHYNIKPAFGQLASVFPLKSAYQTISERKLNQKQVKQVKLGQLPQLKSPKKLPKLHQQLKKLQSQKRIQQSPAKIINQSNKEDQLNLIKITEQKPIPNAQLNLPKIAEQLPKIAEQKSIPNAQLPFIIKPSTLVIQQKVESTGNSYILRQNSTEDSLTESQIRMGVRQRAYWQVFYYNDKFVLTQKGKHYKAKIPNKRKL